MTIFLTNNAFLIKKKKNHIFRENKTVLIMNDLH